MADRNKTIDVLQELIHDSRADQAEAVFLREDSGLARFNRSTIHQHVAEENQTLILRVIKDKRIAVVTTHRLEPNSLRSSLEKALALARVQKPNEDFHSLPGPQAIPELKTYAKGISRLTPRKKVKTLKEIFRLAKDRGMTVSGAFSHGEVEVSVLNSLGVEAHQKYSDAFLHLIVQNEFHSGYASFISRDPDDVDPASLVQEAIQKVSPLAPIRLEPGEYEAILEPYAVHDLLIFLAHLGFHALAVQEGRSFLCEHFGGRLVDEKITIYDDGLDPLGLQVPFDFEGVPKRRVTFFDRGIAKEITYDSFTAGKEGKDSTGHAFIAPNPDGPIPINLFMEGGDSSLESMIRSTRKGIYINRFHYTNVVEPKRAVITGLTRDGTFWIEDGELRRPIRNLRFTESILGAFSRTAALSKERRLCSHGTVYSRRFMTGSVVPAMKISGFHFSGVSEL